MLNAHGEHGQFGQLPHMFIPSVYHIQSSRSSNPCFLLNIAFTCFFISCDFVGKNSTQSGDMDASEDPVTNKPSSENLIWNMFLGKSTASRMLHINFSTNLLLTTGQKLHSTEVERPGPHATNLDGSAPFGHNSSLQEPIHNNDTGHLLLLNRTLLPSFHSGNRTNHTRYKCS